MYVLSIKVPIRKKKSGNLFNDPRSLGEMWIYSFLEGNSLKVNLKVRLEFELAYYDVAVQHFNHYTTGASAPVAFVVDNWINIYLYLRKYDFQPPELWTSLVDFFFFLPSSWIIIKRVVEYGRSLSIGCKMHVLFSGLAGPEDTVPLFGAEN